MNLWLCFYIDFALMSHCGHNSLCSGQLQLDVNVILKTFSFIVSHWYLVRKFRWMIRPLGGSTRLAILEREKLFFDPFGAVCGPLWLKLNWSIPRARGTWETQGGKKRKGKSQDQIGFITPSWGSFHFRQVHLLSLAHYFIRLMNSHHSLAHGLVPDQLYSSWEG